MTFISHLLLNISLSATARSIIVDEGDFLTKISPCCPFFIACNTNSLSFLNSLKTLSF